jgi:hypothetical protein
MAIVVATRMHVRRFWFVPAFMLASFRIAWQAARTPGFLGGRLRAEPSGTYWTLTVWQSGRAMAAFRDSGIHSRVAPKSAHWADEAVFGTWQSGTGRVPSWREASARTAGQPYFAPLEHPAPAHLAGRARPTRLIGFDIPIPRLRRARAADAAGERASFAA